MHAILFSLDWCCLHPVDHAFSYVCEETSSDAPAVTGKRLITKNPKYKIAAGGGIVSKLPDSGGSLMVVFFDRFDEMVKSGLVGTKNDEFSIVGKKITLGQGFEAPKTTDLAGLSNVIPMISGGEIIDLRQSKLIPVKYTKYQNMVSLQTIQTSETEMILKAGDLVFSMTSEVSNSETIHLESGVVVESTGVGSVSSIKKDGKDQPVPSKLKNIKTERRCVLVDKVPVK